MMIIVIWFEKDLFPWFCIRQPSDTYLWIVEFLLLTETVPKEYVTTCMSDIQDDVIISFWVLFVSGSIDSMWVSYCVLDLHHSCNIS